MDGRYVLFLREEGHCSDFSSTPYYEYAEDSWEIDNVIAKEKCHTSLLRTNSCAYPWDFLKDIQKI
ncbi:hypothetical protein V1226_07030 [Lachnospiraceae bacterium JLR.KK009]|jgi:hypothetical protein